MIFSRLFHRRNRYVQEEYDQSEYADLQTENIVEELNLSDEAQAKRYVVDLCEQMINTAKDLEDAKAEYDLVTSYLTDVQTIEDLKDEEKAPIVECATHVAKLDKERSEFLKTERKLSDTQFAQMQEEEDQLPGIIKRLKSNESYLDAIKKIWLIWREKSWNGACYAQSQSAPRRLCANRPVICLRVLQH